MKNVVYFITHPDVIIDPTIPITEWGLSDVGRQRVIDLLGMQWIQTIDLIYSSGENKAIDCAKIIAQHLGINYTVIRELGEVDRSATGYLPPEKHKTVVDLFYAYPEKSIQGRERAVDAQARIIASVESILQNNDKNHNIAIISHGAVGALLLAYLKGMPITKIYSQPGNSGGYYFSFRLISRRLISGWKKIDLTDT